MKQESLNNTVLILIVIAVSALFFSMIQPFLMAIFLAGICSTLTRPVLLHINSFVGNRIQLASAFTLIVVIILVLLPLLVLTGIVVAQALDVSQSIRPWVKQALEQPDAFSSFFEHLPFYEYLVPYRETVLEKTGALVGSLSKWVIGGLSSATLGTVHFLFMCFVFLYTLFFFQMSGKDLIHKILFYLPLKHDDEHLMLEKFTSVTRATLKGTMLIGFLQGGLAGIAFAIVGIDNAVFWGTVMAVLSVIPSIGSAIIWLPASIFLIMQGSIVAGIGLIMFCGIIVGSVDNILRPILVGRDTKMPELMIFFGTLGGIIMFGIAGIVIGPIIASLFITVWQLYGIAFSQYLPQVAYEKENIAIQKKSSKKNQSKPENNKDVSE